MTKHALLAAVAAVTTAVPMTPAGAADPAAIARGKYLVAIASCNDCHTPGYFLGKPDMARFLGGSEVGFEMPGLGVFHGPNLTPDKATGLGNWTDAADRRGDPEGPAARRPHAGADHALARLRHPHQAGCRCHRGLSAQPAADRQQGAGPIRPDRDADLVRHEDRPPRAAR